jgi:hypothetical protein
MSILRHLLEQRGIQPQEAGGTRTPGENAFCVKICSKIITSQFCIVLLNQDQIDGRLVSNANVNMEYGLMLGFNKYVIPFQRAGETLPFNVAGLDTVIYEARTFEQHAAAAIDQAIAATTPEPGAHHPPNEALFLYLVSQGWALADAVEDKAIYQLGAHLGFNLLVDMSGVRYTFLGNFTHLRTEAVIWRARMLSQAVDSRRASWNTRVRGGLMTVEQATVAEELFGTIELWLVVTSDADRETVEEALHTGPLNYASRVISMDNVRAHLERMGDVIA